MDKQKTVPIATAFSAIISVQIGAAVAKTIFPLVGSSGVAAYRIGFSALLLLFLLKPYTLTVSKSGGRHLLAYGAVLGLMNLLIYKSFSYIPIGIAVSLEVLGPLGVSLLTSRKKENLLWLFFALTGLILLPLGSVTQALDYRGVVFALAAALCWGLYIILSKRVAPMGSRSVAIGMLVAALFVVPLGFVQAGTALFSPTAICYGGLVSILSSTLPYVLDMQALKYLPSSVFGILMSASPAVSAISSHIILQEHLSQLQWLGIGCISIACLGCSLLSLRKSSSVIAG